MRRAYQVLVIPYTIINNQLNVYIFQRKNGNWWQFISGGGEGEESISETAIREMMEETGIQVENDLIELHSTTYVPVSCFSAEQRRGWSDNTFVIPEYSFAVNISFRRITLSAEHLSFQCVAVKDAMELLRYDSNRTALYELQCLFETDSLHLRYYDTVKPNSEWEFNDGVSQVFHNMLRRSIPELEMMRSLVTLIGENYIVHGKTIMDLGCSCGDSLLPFVRKHGNSNYYIGIDQSEPMLQQARTFFEYEIREGYVSFINQDVCADFPNVDCCLVLSVLTMQFLPVEKRQHYLECIFDTLSDGGALILVEKVLGDDPDEDVNLVKTYYQLKNMNGYSWQSIERKRISLQNNMKPAKISENVSWLYHAGFSKVNCFWRCLNFVAWVAIK